MTLGEAIAEAVYEQDLHIVVASRCLRILNPWAILANASSLRRAA
jgi:hypothetical protein